MNKGDSVRLSRAGIAALGAKGNKATRLGVITGHSKNSVLHYVRWAGHKSSFRYHRDLLVPAPSPTPAPVDAREEQVFVGNPTKEQ